MLQVLSFVLHISTSRLLSCVTASLRNADGAEARRLSHLLPFPETVATWILREVATCSLLTQEITSRDTRESRGALIPVLHWSGCFCSQRPRGYETQHYDAKRSNAFVCPAKLVLCDMATLGTDTNSSGEALGNPPPQKKIDRKVSKGSV